MSRLRTDAGGFVLSAKGRGPAVRTRPAARRLRRVAFGPGLRLGRRVTSVVVAPVLAASGLVVPVAVAAGGAAAVTAVSWGMARTPAKAALLSGSALVLSTSVNGGASSAEAQAAQALGLSVTVAAPSTWDSMTKAQFQAYSVIIIGDPSTSTSCAATVPADALSTAGTWGAAVNGNVAVLGTAPALAGATSVISDSIYYAASGGSGKTGLYVSLNCEYSTAAAGTSVPLLASVDGGGFTVTGQSSACPSAAGTVNTWQALALPQFRGLTSASLGPWPSPGCSVEETFGSWPTGLDGVAYLGGPSPATFTASDGATGQAYILAGAPVSSATAALAPSTGGLVPAGAMFGGANMAAPAVLQATAGDPVNTENGDFTQAATDLSVPGFGPSLSFTRTYDAQAAQAQTKTGTPGPMGYGWTGNWSSSLSAASPVPGDIYTIDGEALANGSGGPPGSAPEDGPQAVENFGGNTYIADGNRVEEIPGATGTQWGMSMTAGDLYIIAGSPSDIAGMSGSGTAASASLLNFPESIAVDLQNDVFIADTGNNRVVELVVGTGKLQVVAGTGTAGTGADGIAATSSALDAPVSIVTSQHNLYVADSSNNRIQEVPASTGTQWGQSMTAGDVYTVAGSAAGTQGNSGEGGLGTSALLSLPEGMAFNGSGNLFIAVTGDNKVQELSSKTSTQWGIAMTTNHIYTVAGQAGGSEGTGGDGGKATSAFLNQPAGVSAANGEQLYIADAGNSRIQELAISAHTEFGISMTANDIYTIAGQANGSSGYSGDGGSATSAKVNDPQDVYVTNSSPEVMYVADTGNSRVRQVNSSGTISNYAGNGFTMATTGNGGPAVDAGLSLPAGEVFDANGDVIFADAGNNRIQEIAATAHTQWGISMQAGDVYTIAGDARGAFGSSGDGGAATSALLDFPDFIAIGASGNLFIADTINCRVQEITASTGKISTVAGSPAGTCGNSGDAGPATSALLSDPGGVWVDAAGDIYIADTFNDQVREVFAAGGQSFGQSMTAGDIYTIAGSRSGAAGTSGDGGAATSALLDGPEAVGVDGTGNVYIADSGNNRIQEVPVTTGAQRGQQMTRYDIYTIAGSASGTAGKSGDGGPAASALLNGPSSATVDAAGDLYIADLSNNRVQEVAVANGTQWGQAMTANHIYTVAGSASGSPGDSGDGGPAASALMNGSESVSLDSANDLYITDGNNNGLREVTSATPATIQPAAGLTSALYPAPGGLTVTQPDGSQVTFYSQSGGNCTAPYGKAGGYCALPQDINATLTFSTGNQTYTYSPAPGTSYTYTSNGALTAQTDAAGNTLTVTYQTPAPGSGQCPATATSCNTITSSSGRALVAGLNASGLVTSVTDPLGRQWTYGYTGSDLTAATDPMGNKTTYTYGSGSTGNPVLANDLLTITSPNAQPGGPDAGDATVNAYNPAGQVTTQTDPMGFKTTFDYTGMNPATGTGIVRVNDPDGNTTVYDYTQGALAAQSAWTGATLSSENDFIPDVTAGGASGGTLLDATSSDGNGNISNYTYDTSGNTTSTTAPDGVGTQTGTTTTQYTPIGNDSCDATVMATTPCSASQTGPAPVSPGGVITPPSTAPPSGETWTLNDTDGNQLYATTGVYPPGSSSASYLQTTYQLFKGNNVTLNGTNVSCTSIPPSPSLPCARINADGVVTQLAYNPQGDLTSSSTPDGNGSELATTTYAYNGDGEQTSQVAPDGNVSGANTGNYTTVTAWNADGIKTSVTEAGGSGATVTPRTTNYGYDADGNQTTVKNARGYTTTMTYNADDKAAVVTNSDGDATLTCYDGDGNAAQTVPAVGVAANSLTAASCPASYPSGYANRLASDATVSTFNALGKQTQQTTSAPAGQTGYETTTYAHDGEGNPIQVTAPPSANGGQNQVTVDRYNDAGQLASETTGYGTSAAATVSYCYDPNGDKTSVVYADGNTGGIAQCETSSPWVVSSATYPTQAAYQTTYSYDSTAELVSTTAPATAAAPSGATTTLTYDAAGNKLTSKDPAGVTTTWTYTPSNHAATVSYSGSSAHSVSYTYDPNGNKTAMTDATGSSSYIYDPFGELASASNGANQTTGYAYNADGQVTSITYPLPPTATWATSNSISYSFDNADKLTGVTDFTGNKLTISNTADNLPYSEILGSTGDTITTTYDPTDAASAITLKSSSSTLQSFTYTNSPAGTILNEADTPVSSNSPVVYTYDAKGRVASMTPGNGSTLSYGFDTSGDLTTLPNEATGTYDKAGELTSSALTGTTTNYSYNADGERLTATQGSTTVASGTWNGVGQLTAYSDSAANMTAATYDGNGERASTTITPSGKSAITQGYVWNDNNLLMDGTSAYIYLGGNAPAEQVSLANGTVTYLVADLLGSVRGTVNFSGALTGTTSYDAWGNPLTTAGLTATTPFGFAGSYTDPDGLLYLINRYYDPASGQLTSVDPDLIHTLLPYAYTAGDPVTQTDPAGLASTAVCSLHVRNIREGGGGIFSFETVQVCSGPFGWQKTEGQVWRSSWSGPRGYGNSGFSRVTRANFASYIWTLRCNRGHGWYDYWGAATGFSTGTGWAPGWVQTDTSIRRNCGHWPP